MIISSFSVYLTFFLAIQIWTPSLMLENVLAKKPQEAKTLPTIKVKSQTPTSPASLVARLLTYDPDLD